MRTGDLYEDFVIHTSEQLIAFDLSEETANTLAKALRDFLRNEWERMLQDMHDKALALFKAENLPKEEAENIAKYLRDFFYKHWLGQSLYFPFNDKSCFIERNKAIYDEYDGSSVVMLARKYKISEQRIYKIISQIREERRRLKHEKAKKA